MEQVCITLLRILDELWILLNLYKWQIFFPQILSKLEG